MVVWRLLIVFGLISLPYYLLLIHPPSDSPQSTGLGGRLRVCGQPLTAALRVVHVPGVGDEKGGEGLQIKYGRTMSGEYFTGAKATEKMLRCFEKLSSSSSSSSVLDSRADEEGEDIGMGQESMQMVFMGDSIMRYTFYDVFESIKKATETEIMSNISDHNEAVREPKFAQFPKLKTRLSYVFSPMLDFPILTANEWKERVLSFGSKTVPKRSRGRRRMMIEEEEMVNKTVDMIMAPGVFSAKGTAVLVVNGGLWKMKKDPFGVDDYSAKMKSFALLLEAIITRWVGLEGRKFAVFFVPIMPVDYAQVVRVRENRANLTNEKIREFNRASTLAMANFAPSVHILSNYPRCHDDILSGNILAENAKMFGQRMRSGKNVTRDDGLFDGLHYTTPFVLACTSPLFSSFCEPVFQGSSVQMKDGCKVEGSLTGGMMAGLDTTGHFVYPCAIVGMMAILFARIKKAPGGGNIYLMYLLQYFANGYIAIVCMGIVLVFNLYMFEYNAILRQDTVEWPGHSFAALFVVCSAVQMICMVWCLWNPSLKRTLTTSSAGMSQESYSDREIIEVLERNIIVGRGFLIFAMTMSPVLLNIDAKAGGRFVENVLVSNVCMWAFATLVVVEAAVKGIIMYNGSVQTGGESQVWKAALSHSVFSFVLALLLPITLWCILLEGTFFPFDCALILAFLYTVFYWLTMAVSPLLSNSCWAVSRVRLFFVVVFFAIMINVFLLGVWDLEERITDMTPTSLNEPLYGMWSLIDSSMTSSRSGVMLLRIVAQFVGSILPAFIFIFFVIRALIDGVELSDMKLLEAIDAYEFIHPFTKYVFNITYESSREVRISPKRKVSDHPAHSRNAQCEGELEFGGASVSVNAFQSCFKSVGQFMVKTTILLCSIKLLFWLVLVFERLQYPHFTWDMSGVAISICSSGILLVGVFFHRPCSADTPRIPTSVTQYLCCDTNGVLLLIKVCVSELLDLCFFLGTAYLEIVIVFSRVLLANGFSLSIPQVLYLHGTQTKTGLLYMISPYVNYFIVLTFVLSFGSFSHYVTYNGVAVYIAKPITSLLLRERTPTKEGVDTINSQTETGP
eukprot:Nk52_evm57s343 gene=Nk52_evmTU57s343